MRGDVSNVIVEDSFYPSNDGAMIPCVIVRNRNVLSSLAQKPEKPIPTWIYMYGGFGVNQEAKFLGANVLTWV